MNRKPIKVLVVDDMPLVRDLLTRGLSMDPGIDVVASAEDPYAARDLIVKLRPDVMTLDVEMPRMNGVDFLRKLMPQYPLPTVMVSSLTERGKQITIEALQAGAVDFVAKPSSSSQIGMNAMIAELRTKVKIAASSNVSHWKYKRQEKREVISSRLQGADQNTIIAIGASTGGTEAIKEVITRLPAHTPGIVIVQHMPKGFTKMFSDRMNTLSQMVVKEAEHGDVVSQGHILIAPGGVQMRVVQKGRQKVITLGEDTPCCGHSPSVEVLMQSVAKLKVKHSIAVMLTGMGKDGAIGMKAMRDAGARTLAQNEETSVVFGMPKEAYKSGGAEKLVSLNQIADRIIELLEHQK